VFLPDGGIVTARLGTSPVPSAALIALSATLISRSTIFDTMHHAHLQREGGAPVVKAARQGVAAVRRAMSGMNNHR
jgi:hypothetical protein